MSTVSVLNVEVLVVGRGGSTLAPAHPPCPAPLTFGAAGAGGAMAKRGLGSAFGGDLPARRRDLPRLRPLMHPSALAVTDPHRLARAFLALGDDLAPERLQRSLVRAFAALAAAFLLAVGAPLTWTAPSAISKAGDPLAATLGNSKAVLADDEDDDGGG